MGDLNRVVLTGFVTDSEGIEFKPSKGKSFLVVRSDRFSGTPDDIIVEIPRRLKNTFREWNWVRVSGKFRSRWGVINGKKKEFLYLEALDINTEGNLLINTVEMTACICKKPVLRKTPLGKTICEVRIAVNGNDRSDYIPCICWKNLAVKASEMGVGTKVKLKGRMQSRGYWKKQRDNSYVRKTAYEVSVIAVEEIKDEKGNFEKTER
mgnify:CR=1 FL=1